MNRRCTRPSDSLPMTVLATTDAIGGASGKGVTPISEVRNSEPNGSANAIDAPVTTLITASWKKERDRSGEGVFSLIAVTNGYCLLAGESGNQISHCAGNISHDDDRAVATVISTT